MNTLMNWDSENWLEKFNESESKEERDLLNKLVFEKNVEIELSGLPVGAFHAEFKTGLDRKYRKNHTGYDVKVKYILGKESLEPSEVGILVDSRRHRISQFVEADSPLHTEWNLRPLH